MSAATAASGAEAFLRSPLVQWLRSMAETYSDAWKSEAAGRSIVLADLADGILLNEIMANVHFGPYIATVQDDAADNPDSRRHNLEVLLEGMTNYYQDALSTVIIMELPLVEPIVRDPASDASLEALRRFLMLMLGATVKCKNKERFVEQMKALPEAVQLELVKCIKEVFQSTLEVPFDTLERLSTAELSDMCRTALEYLNQAVAERDSYARRLDSALAMHVMALPAAPSPKPAPAQSDTTAAETLKLQAQLRAVTDELDLRNAAYEQLAMDDARRRDEFAALSSKVRELQILADEARALRDDVDIWRSRAADHERTKAELVALTQRLEDTEYGSNRIQELEERNRLLADQIDSLREAASTSESLREQLAHSEREMRRVELNVAELNAAQAQHIERIRELTATAARSDDEVKYLQDQLQFVRKELTEAHSREAAGAEESSSKVDRGDFMQLQAAYFRAEAELKSRGVYEADREDLLGQISSLRAKVRTAEEQARNLQADLTVRTQRQNDLQRALEDAQDELSRIKGRGEDYAEAVSKEQQRMQELETKLESTLKKSLALKDDRIRVLEGRLQEVLAANQQLVDEFSLTLSLCESLTKSNTPATDQSSSASRLRRPESGRLLSLVSHLRADILRQRDSREEMAHVQEELSELRKQLAATKRDTASVDLYRNRAHTAERSLQTVKQQYSAILDKLQKHLRGREALEAENRDLVRQVTELQQHRDRYRSQRDSLQALLVSRGGSQEPPGSPARHPPGSPARPTASVASAAAASAAGSAAATPPTKSTPDLRKGLNFRRFMTDIVGKRQSKTRSVFDSPQLSAAHSPQLTPNQSLQLAPSQISQHDTPRTVGSPVAQRVRTPNVNESRAISQLFADPRSRSPHVNSNAPHSPQPVPRPRLQTVSTVNLQRGPPPKPYVNTPPRRQSVLEFFLEDFGQRKWGVGGPQAADAGRDRRASPATTADGTAESNLSRRRQHMSGASRRGLQGKDGRTASTTSASPPSSGLSPAQSQGEPASPPVPPAAEPIVARDSSIHSGVALPAAPASSNAETSPTQSGQRPLLAHRRSSSLDNPASQQDWFDFGVI